MMQRYKNLQRNSGVLAFELGDDFIKVEFENHGVYLYTAESAGREKIEAMKKRALAGKGLSTFISQHVKNQYASKIK